MPPPRILNPRLVPVSGTDAHLPPLSTHALDPATLRARFSRAAGWLPEIAGDGSAWGGQAPVPAAVLVPLVLRASGLQVLLTRRTEHLRDHAGQISFPGGRSEPDDEGPAGTALREAQEEVGLRRESVHIIGQMPAYTTVTSFVVTPVVALVHPPLDLALDTFEVAEAFEVPLAFLMNPSHHRRHVITHAGAQRQFLSMPWQGIAADGTPREYFIWGATAAMLRNLYRLLAD